MDKKAYLQQDPEADKIITFDNGVRILPFAVIEQYLDELCDYNWSTKSFIHSYSIINNAPSISASIELAVIYKIKRTLIYRTLVGAVTYPLEFFKAINPDIDSLGNQHYAASAKSLCIVNAAKSIGKRFGRDLNLLNIPVPAVPVTIYKNNEQHIDYKLRDEYDILKDALMNCTTFYDASVLLSNSQFRNDPTLTELINQKK